MNLATVLSNFVSHIDIFPAVETIGRIVPTDFVKELLRHGHVTGPINPTLLRGDPVSILAELLVTIVTIHARVRGVRELIQVNTDYTVLPRGLMVLEVVCYVVGVGLQVIIATNENIGISRAVASVQRCHTTAILFKNNLGQVQLTFGNVAVNHGLAVIDIAVEDHDDLEILLRLLGKRVQRVVQDLCAPTRGDNDRSLIAVSRHAFPSG